MPRTVRLRELLIGVEGLALLRHLYDGSDEAAERRLAEVRRVLEEDGFADGQTIEEASPDVGYRAWSHNYDEPGNPIVALEQGAVWPALEALPRGRALDAACGTGRHAQRLVELGHEVTGVDLTRQMLTLAAAKVPGATFIEADLASLPIRAGAFDLVVCGLALSHLRDLRAGIAELSRVLRSGGTLVVSVLHPLQSYLGWHAPFEDAAGARGFVREHPHGHADYLAAFRAMGLSVVDCVEPLLCADHVPEKRRVFRHVPEAAIEAYVGLPGVLVWVAQKD